MFKPVILSLGTGYKVRNAAGDDLGRIEEIVLDQADGCVHYGVLSSGGFLHVGTQLVAIPWARLQMQNDQKSFFLNIDKETLKNGPHFDRDNWPDMTLAEWRERVETYFSYNPADETEAAEGGEFIQSGANTTASMQERTADERLARRVEFELFATKAFNMDNLHVTAKAGNVVLQGRVESRAEAILAENTAIVVDGVNGVENKLRVSKVA